MRVFLVHCRSRFLSQLLTVNGIWLGREPLQSNQNVKLHWFWDPSLLGNAREAMQLPGCNNLPESVLFFSSRPK